MRGFVDQSCTPHRPSMYASCLHDTCGLVFCLDSFLLRIFAPGAALQRSQAPPTRRDATLLYGSRGGTKKWKGCMQLCVCVLCCRSGRPTPSCVDSFGTPRRISRLVVTVEWHESWARLVQRCVIDTHACTNMHNKPHLIPVVQVLPPDRQFGISSAECPAAHHMCSLSTVL